MEKRYQVFVSSTFEDLREERQEVLQALLELDCIPAGMELFPAADDDQWTLIKKVLDRCDYYLLISGGRYGSLGAEGMGYTEMEYRYALSTGMPIISFIHHNPLELPAGRTEKTDAGKQQLENFRALVRQKMCKTWTTAADLGSAVSRSIVRLMSSRPAVGWIRADEAMNSLAAAEVLALRKKIDDLERQLSEAQLSAPSGSERLAKGDEEFPVDFTFRTLSEGQYWNWTYSTDVSWDAIFYDVGPYLLDEATDLTLKHALDNMVRRRSRHNRENDSHLEGHTKHSEFSISSEDFQTIKIQLRALGLITKSLRNRGVKDTATYWAITPYGDKLLTNLRAISSSDGDESNEDEFEDEEQDSPAM